MASKPLFSFCRRGTSRALPRLGVWTWKIDDTQKLRHSMDMLCKAIMGLHRAVLIAAFSIALIATGFAHRMPSPQDEALAFALANGAALADFCGDKTGAGSKGGADCLACQIAGSADLPVATGALIDLELAFVATVVAPREDQALRRILDPAHSPQGPPAA
jgi:hypothetical protein